MKFAGEVTQDTTLWQDISAVLSFIFHSPLFTVIKVLAAIYTAVLVVNIILLIILNGAQKSIRKERRGANLPTYAEARRRWRRIMSYVKKGTQNYYKAAILEADQMVENLLTDTGSKEPTMHEKIQRLKEQYIDSAEDLEKAHAMSMRIVREPSLTLSRKDVDETLALYRHFLEDMEVFG